MQRAVKADRSVAGALGDAPFADPWVLRTATGVLAGLVLVVQWWLAPHGVGLWDEGYVLSLITRPGDSVLVGEPYLFGFVLNPVMRAVGFDLAEFRWVGLSVLVLSATQLARSGLRLVARSGDGRIRPSVRLLIAGVVAAASTLAVTGPSRVLDYRALAIVGLMWVCAGLAELQLGRTRLGGGIVGLAGWIVFCGKPTSALVASVVVLVFTLRACNPAWRRFLPSALLGFAAGVASTCVSAGMTPMGLVRYLEGGFRQVSVLGGHGSVAQILGLVSQPLLGSLVGVLLLLLPTLGLAITHQVGKPLPASAWTVVGAGSLCALVLVISSLSRGSGEGVEALAVGPIGLVLALVVLIGLRSRPRRGEIRPFVLLLLLMPYVASVGSNRWFSEQMPLALAFWVMGACLLALEPTWLWGSVNLLGRHGVSVVAFSCALVVCTLVVLDLERGENGQRALEAETPVDTRLGTVTVPRSDARLLRTLASLRDAGLAEGTPVADLTGLAHGYRFYLGGRPLGRAATFGGFPGAVSAAREAMAKEPCRAWAESWILTSPNDPYGVGEVFTERGLDLTNDFELVGSFPFVQGSAPFLRDLRVEVLRPRPSVGEKLACGRH